MRKIISDDRSRQGPQGRPVLAVLIGGLALCAVAIVGYLVWVMQTSPADPGQAASRQTVPGSTSSNPTDRISPANPAYPAPAEPSATGTTKP